MKRSILGAFLLAAFAGAPLQAQQQFFGEDPDPPPLTNSSAAEADFLANLIGVGTEDFEGFRGYGCRTARDQLRHRGYGHADWWR